MDMKTERRDIEVSKLNESLTHISRTFEDLNLEMKGIGKEKYDKEHDKIEKSFTKPHCKL